MSFNTIEIERDGHITTVWLNRPRVHNAFDEHMIAELNQVVEDLKQDTNTRILIFRGRGKSFCAGADLNWMKRMSEYSYEENMQDSRELARLMYAIYTFPKPTIAVLHGAVIGGGNGIASACDMAFCESDTTFSLSEVKIGLVPSVIGPYVIKRVGEYNARMLMLSGLRFKGADAEKYGLVNGHFNQDDLEAKVAETVKFLLTSGPEAMRMCKELIFNLVNHMSMQEALEYTSKIIADVRASDEGKEGIASFLEKRKPDWVD
ncbi:MAG: enoyl-CoA hydratase/isomerase family protein [Calditrichia bacterium]